MSALTARSWASFRARDDNCHAILMTVLTSSGQRKRVH